ncbi:MAG: PIN domain nuclease [Anaerolineales bacterium]|nr:PIN domain nuclease [Anaerolineales bacterium]
MRLGPLFRILGTVLYGFIGWEIGITLVGTTQLDTDTWKVIVPATLIGAVFGFVFAPWLVIAPARAARNALRQVPINDLVAGTIGLSIGLLIAALLAYPMSRLPPPFGGIVPFILVLLFGYLGATVFTLRQNDIYGLVQRRSLTTPVSNPPSSTASAEVEHEPILLLDTSVIIDGRIADIAKTGFLLGRLTVPRFVLNELQYIADSPDSLRRNRGRRGLEILDRLQNTPGVAIDFIDKEPGNATQVDDKLVSLAKQTNSIVLTNDYNLNRVAKLQGVRILNINELVNAVKSVYLPGEGIP